MSLLRLLIGSIGGFVATGPMTVAMILLHRMLPCREQYSLPPREITMKLADDAGVADKLDRGDRSVLTLLSHFGYGAAAGGIYSITPRMPAPGPLNGVAFGLLLWIVSYLGWLPALGVLRPVTKQPPRRTALMIAVHLVWGFVLGTFVELVGRELRPLKATKPL